MTDMPRSGQSRRLSDEELLDAVPSGTGGKEAKVGFFVLLGLVSFIVVLFWMTDPATLRGRYIIVTMVENAGGVRSGDPVQMQGVNIGRVHDFEMLGPGRVVIELEIEGAWGIPEGSRVTMGESGLFGGRTIVIEQGMGDRMISAGDTIPGQGVAGGGLLGSVDQLSVQAGGVLTAIDSLLNPSTIGNVQGSARELEHLLTELSGMVREQRTTLAELTRSLTVAAQGFETAAATGPDVASAAARADSAMAVLTATTENLDAATASLRTVLGRMEAGEGTLGRLSTDDSLYANLNAAAQSLNELLADVRANPNRYINISIF
jgi:phospholipid/cholesterol/gamma-HCH transport system substrate-binding protein